MSTNVVTITNLEVVTNTLSKIDIMNISTDWNVLRVTIFGALLTAISTGFYRIYGREKTLLV